MSPAPQASFTQAAKRRSNSGKNFSHTNHAVSSRLGVFACINIAEVVGRCPVSAS